MTIMNNNINRFILKRFFYVLAKANRKIYFFN